MTGFSNILTLDINKFNQFAGNIEDDKIYKKIFALYKNVKSKYIVKYILCREENNKNLIEFENYIDDIIKVNIKRYYSRIR